MPSTLLPQDDNDNPIPALRYLDDGEGNTKAHNVSGAAADTDLIAFDGTTELISIKTTGKITIKFGDSSVVATANDHGFLGGEKDVVPITDPFKGEQAYSHLSIYYIEDAEVFVSERG